MKFQTRVTNRSAVPGAPVGKRHQAYSNKHVDDVVLFCSTKLRREVATSLYGIFSVLLFAVPAVFH